MATEQPANERKYWLKAGSYALTQRLLAFVFGFGSYFLLVRYFPVDAFGIWTLYVVVSSAVELSRSSFIQNAFLKFFNEADADRALLFYSSMALNAISTLIVCALLLMLTPVMADFWDSDEIVPLIYCYVATCIVLVPFTQLNYLEQANHQFRGTFYSSVVRQGVFFVVVVFAFFFWPDLPLVFFAFIHVVAAALGAITAYFFNKDLIPEVYKVSRATMSKLFRFGRYILGTGLTSNIGKNADQIILGGMSHGMVAMYNACMRVLNFVEIPTLSIASISYPKIAAQASSGHEAVGRMYEKSVAMILALIIPVVIFVLIFPKFVLIVVAGEKYLDAAQALQIVAVGSLFLPFNVQVGSACEVIGKPNISFLINLFANLANLLVNLLLIPKFGFVGAALTFLMTVIFIFSVGQWYVHSKMKVSLGRIGFEIISNYRTGVNLAFGFLKRKLP